MNRLARTSDKVLLKGLVFHGFHGVLPAENCLGQKFVVDLEAEMDLRPAGISDSLEDTVDYGKLYEHVETVITGDSHELVESVASQIAQHVLTGFPEIHKVSVTVNKPHVAFKGVLAGVGVEITRERADYPE